MIHLNIRKYLILKKKRNTKKDVEIIVLLQNSVPVEYPMLLLSLILWMINICFTFFVVFYIFNKLFIKKEIKDLRAENINVINIITWFIFLLLVGIANIIGVLIRFYLTDQGLSNFLEKISLILFYSAIAVKVFYLEYAINKWKYYKGYYFSIISVLTVIFFIVIEPSDFKVISPLQLFTLILIIADFSFLPILYFILSIKTKGKDRKNAFKISAGTVFLGLGLLIRPLILEGYYGISDFLDILINYTYLTAPTAILIAMILIFDSMRGKRPEA